MDINCLHDAEQKFKNTVVLYKNKAYWVKGVLSKIAGYMLIGVELLTNGDVSKNNIDIPIKDVNLNFELGWTFLPNNPERAMFVERTTNRQYAAGLKTAELKWYFKKAMGNTTSALLTCLTEKYYRNMDLFSYNLEHDNLHTVSIAITKKVAVHRGRLMFNKKIIGYFNGNTCTIVNRYFNNICYNMYFPGVEWETC